MKHTNTTSKENLSSIVVNCWRQEEKTGTIDKRLTECCRNDLATGKSDRSTNAQKSDVLFLKIVRNYSHQFFPNFCGRL